jgi:hypothetical protein
LAPELARDYRQRLAELWTGFHQWRHGTRGADEQPKHAGASSLVPGVIYCTQFVLLVLAIALVLVTGAVLFRLLQPRYVSARVAIEYGAAFFFFFFFFFFLAAAAFRAGILGRRVKPRVWQPDQDWLPQARKEATATFFVMLAVAWAYAAFNAVKSEIPGWLSPSPFSSCWQATPASRRAAEASPGDAAILQWCGSPAPPARPATPLPEPSGRRSTPAGFCCCWPLSVSPSA